MNFNDSFASIGCTSKRFIYVLNNQIYQFQTFKLIKGSFYQIHTVYIKKRYIATSWKTTSKYFFFIYNDSAKIVILLSKDNEGKDTINVIKTCTCTCKFFISFRRVFTPRILGKIITHLENGLVS